MLVVDSQAGRSGNASWCNKLGLWISKGRGRSIVYIHLLADYFHKTPRDIARRLMGDGGGTTA